jgi:hypothetical protein
MISMKTTVIQAFGHLSVPETLNTCSNLAWNEQYMKEKGQGRPFCPQVET